MDWHEFFGEYGARENGGGARALDVFEHRTLPWALSAEFTWTVPVTFRDVTGPAVVVQTRNLAFTAGQASDGTLVLTFDGDALDDPVAVNVVVAAADNAAAISSATRMAVLGTPALNGIVSVTDNVGNVDLGSTSYIDVTVEWIPDWQVWDVQFGGVIANGNYDTTYLFDGYNPIVVRTVRAAAVPVDEAALAVQHEADTEGNPALVGLVVSADDDTVDANTIIFETGAPDVTLTCAAPAGATLTPTDITGEVEVAQTEIVSVRLRDLAPRGRFPRGVDRCTPAVRVLDAWGAGRTLTIGDDGAEDAVMGSTPIDLNAEARTFGDVAAAEALPRYESAWEPLATFNLGDPATLAAGRLVIEIEWSPTP